VKPYDFRAPMRDGMMLVGMECHHQNRTLELGLFFAISPPQKRMDLWNVPDLVKFDPKTYMLTDVYNVEKDCGLGDEHYRVRLTGIPGAVNAMWICGAGTGVHASVWRDRALVFDDDLYKCSKYAYIRKVVFRNGATPEIEVVNE
jgi:hypothetical protein